MPPRPLERSNILATYNCTNEGKGWKWDRIELLSVSGGGAPIAVKKCLSEGAHDCFSFKAAVARNSILKKVQQSVLM